MNYVIVDSDGDRLCHLELSCRPDVPACCCIRFSRSQGIVFSEREEADAAVQFIVDCLDFELGETLEVVALLRV